MADDLEAEFGASPLGKSKQSITARMPSTANASPPLPSASLPTASNIDDMYGDLFSSGGAGETLLHTQVAQLKDTVSKQAALIQSLESKIKQLEEQNKTLTQENSTLTTNISSLYNTAKLEIQRKDDRIKELQDRERQAVLGKSTSGRDSSRGRDHSIGDRLQGHYNSNNNSSREGSRDRHHHSSRR